MRIEPHRLPTFTPVIFTLALLPGMAHGGYAAARTASDETLERCRYLHGRIEFYTDRRRSGGSGAQMERWRKSRQRFEREFREQRCHRFGRRLRGDR